MAGTTTRQRYLEAVVEHILVEGRTDLPLVSMAAAAGTSDRMLVYYFKTRDALLTEAIQSIRTRRRRRLAKMLALIATSETPAAGLETVLRWATGDENAADTRLFYDAAARSFHDDEPFAVFVTDSIRDWVFEGAAAARSLGVEEDRARTFGTLLGALAPSLAADRLTTGDHERVAAAIGPATEVLLSTLEATGD